MSHGTPCVTVDCGTLNEIRATGLSAMTANMRGYDIMQQTGVGNFQHNSNILQHISNKVVDEVGAIESSATRSVMPAQMPAPTGTTP